MSKQNRREFLKIAASVPLVGDVFRPIAIGHSTAERHPDIDSVYGVLYLYGQMNITGKQLTSVKDDEALRQLIQNAANNCAESLYQHCKGVAMRLSEKEVDRFLTPWKTKEFQDSHKHFPPLKREGNRFV